MNHNYRHVRDSSGDNISLESRVNLDNYVGFSDLPNQIHRKATRRPFQFNVMVLGQAGLGKSTLVNTLFLSEVYNKEHPGPSRRIQKTTKVEENKFLLEEKGVQLELTIVDTPGFGEGVDNYASIEPITNYIEDRLSDHLNSEVCRRQARFRDGRIHCCLYFIPPTGQCLRPLDIEVIKLLHRYVNIIPVIGKSDCLTDEECHLFKQQIVMDLKESGLSTYTFPSLSPSDPEFASHEELKQRQPFALVCSTQLYPSATSGLLVRGRKYPWGIVEVDNLNHNDFIALRDLMIRCHLLDLIEQTTKNKYEAFRKDKLVAMVSAPGFSIKSNISPLCWLELERRSQNERIIRMKSEMEAVLQQKLEEKELKIGNSDIQMEREMKQTQSSLVAHRRELDERRSIFEKEKAIWEESQQALEEQRRRQLLDVSSKHIDYGKKSKSIGKGLF